MLKKTPEQISEVSNLFILFCKEFITYKKLQSSIFLKFGTPYDLRYIFINSTVAFKVCVLNARTQKRSDQKLHFEKIGIDWILMWTYHNTCGH